MFDVVQLIVKGKNFWYVMNCCFVMEGSMEFWNGRVMPLNFNNSSVVMESDVVALPFRELLQQFAP